MTATGMKFINSPRIKKSSKKLPYRYPAEDDKAVYFLHKSLNCMSFRQILYNKRKLESYIRAKRNKCECVAYHIGKANTSYAKGIFHRIAISSAIADFIA